ncbi:MAG: tetratricopeptide repeat protein [Planctomycetes bacterium]|nr:tetratricopeptide repeat protein [Planctomycetota bacterium]
MRRGIGVALIAWAATGCTVTQAPRRDSDLVFAQSLSALGDYRQAEAHYRSVLSRDPDNYVALVGIARCHRHARETDRAIEALRAAIRSSEAADPAVQGEAEGLLGDIYLEKRDYQAAREQLSRAFDRATGESRESIAMRLYVACRALGDKAGMDRAYAAIRNRTDRTFAMLRDHHPAGSAPRPSAAPPPPSPRQAAPSAPASRVTGAPRILSREQWNASRVRSNTERMGRITRITIHHTGEESPCYLRGLAETAERIHAFQATHQRRGWADIAYHYLIDRCGRIWAGRSLQYVGAHAGNSRLNQGNIGIAVIGNFNKQLPTDDQIRALRQLVTYLAKRYSVPGSRIYGHGEIRRTDCPGRYLEKQVDLISRAIP